MSRDTRGDESRDLIKQQIKTAFAHAQRCLDVDNLAGVRAALFVVETRCAELEQLPPPQCHDRESGGARCELPMGHEGNHACPEALAAYERRRGWRK